MDEIVIGPRAATCGAAAYRREPIVTTDIATDILWNDYRALAIEQGYRASWASPIVSPQGRLLGALALYARESRAPTAERAARRRIGDAARRHRRRSRARRGIAAPIGGELPLVRRELADRHLSRDRLRTAARRQRVARRAARLRSPLELLQVDMARDLFVSVADRERLLHELETQGELRSAEMEWTRKDGTTVTVRVSARAYRDERGLAVVLGRIRRERHAAARRRAGAAPVGEARRARTARLRRRARVEQPARGDPALRRRAARRRAHVGGSRGAVGHSRSGAPIARRSCAICSRSSDSATHRASA